MNMMTAMNATPERRLPPTMPELTQRIETAIALSGVKPTRFGIDAQCGKNAVADIFAGRRKPFAKVRLRLLDHADLLIEQARQRAFETLLLHFDRRDIGAAVEGLIAMLDERDGDPDLEPNGDELDGSLAEDDFCDHNLSYGGPGCPVSDGGCATGSGAGDPSWTEWQSRGRFKVGKHGEEPCRRSGIPNMCHEDDEDDDPAEADGDEQDGNGSEEDFMYHGGDGAGCPVADAGEHSDESGQCPTFGIDQTKGVGLAEAFHDLNGIPFIRVPAAWNDR